MPAGGIEWRRRNGLNERHLRLRANGVPDDAMRIVNGRYLTSITCAMARSCEWVSVRSEPVAPIA